MPQARQIEGPLEKYSAARGAGWQERHFVLGDAVLSYFNPKARDSQTMFSLMDEDGSGSLDIEEITLCAPPPPAPPAAPRTRWSLLTDNRPPPPARRLCKQMGKKLNKKQLEAAMASMDSDGSGQVEFDEFDTWCVQPQQQQHMPSPRCWPAATDRGSTPAAPAAPPPGGRWRTPSWRRNRSRSATST